jgi:hypothetical protein
MASVMPSMSSSLAAAIARRRRRSGRSRCCEPAQIGADELALELESDEEEEDREQPVGGTCAEAEAQVPRLVAEFEVADREVGLESAAAAPLWTSARGSGIVSGCEPPSVRSRSRGVG